ncbi:MAG: CehA/McbA family metallohydrolase [Planctomycetota bacterium]|jgi:hypothetical protein
MYRRLFHSIHGAHCRFAALRPGRSRPRAHRRPLLHEVLEDRSLLSSGVPFAEGPPGDVCMRSVTADGGTSLEMVYEIVDVPMVSLEVALYRSSDLRVDGEDELLDRVLLDDPADLTTGLHAKRFEIGSGPDQIALPGAGADETDVDYRLLALADPSNAVEEADLHPFDEDNTALLTGVYHAAGGPVFAHGTAADDTVTVSLASLRLEFNGSVYAYTSGAPAGMRIRGHEGSDIFGIAAGGRAGASSVFSIDLWGGDGTDSAHLTGSAHDETVTLRPSSGSFTAPGCQVELIDIRSITAEGGGGGDLAELYDSEESDVFEASPESARLYGSAFENRVTSFRTVYAHGTQGGDDVAKLYGSSRDDRLVATAEYGRLYGDGFFNQAVSFRYLYAYGLGGDDVAKLYDSEGDDRFVAAPDFAKFYGDRFYNLAASFRYVHGHSASGDDVALLYGSEGDDTFVAAPDYGRLYGDGFYCQALAFRYVHAISSGGDDVAKLDDSPGNDVFKATPEYASLSGEGFYHRVLGYRYVHATSSGGDDVAKLYGSAGDDAFVATPEHGTLEGEGFYLRALAFRYLHAAGSGGSDVAKLYDSEADDTFEGTPDYGRLDSPGFHAQAWSFPLVYAYASRGVDVADFHDSSGNDVFISKPTYTSMYGDGVVYHNRAVGFDEVTAWATDRVLGDWAYLYDSQQDDSFYAADDVGELTTPVRVARVHDFTTVKAIASASTEEGSDVMIAHKTHYRLRRVGNWLESRVEILEPEAGQALHGLVEVRVEVVPVVEGRLPTRLYVSIDGPPWIRMTRVGQTNQFVAQVDSTMFPNGPASLEVLGWVPNELPLATTVEIELDNALRSFFADLHSHSGYSDGERFPSDALAYARYTAGVDAFVLTDHLEYLDDLEWLDTREQVWRANEDGGFVTLPGLEWSKPQGHTVIFDPQTLQWPTETAAFYQAAADAGVVVKFNHPGDGTEVFDGLAYSEVGDRAVQMIEVRDAVEEQAYLRALELGWHVAPDGSSDTHGLNWGNAGTWTGIVAPGLSQRNVLAALQSRHLYSTQDRNCQLLLEVNGAVMGDVLDDPVQTVRLDVVVNDPDEDDAIAKIELFEDGAIVQTDQPGVSHRHWSTSRSPTPGPHYYFVKVTQADGNQMWSAPVWVTVAGD